MSQKLNGYQKYEIAKNCKEVLRNNLIDTFSSPRLSDKENFSPKIENFVGKPIYKNCSSSNYCVLYYPAKKSSFSITYFDFWEGEEKN